MKQAIKNKTPQPFASPMHHRLREGLLLMSLGVAVFLLASLASYHLTDPGWSTSGGGTRVFNWGGRVGAWLADILLFLFGAVAYCFPPLIAFTSWMAFRYAEVFDKRSHEWVFRGVGFFCFVASSCGLVSLYFYSAAQLPGSAGGILGDVVSHGLSQFLNTVGSALLLAVVWLCGVTLLTGLSWLWLIDRLGEYIYRSVIGLWDYRKRQSATLALPIKEKVEPLLEKRLDKGRRVIPVIAESAAEIKKPKQKSLETRPVLATSEAAVILAPNTLPPLSLLNPLLPSQEKAFAHISFDELSHLVEQRLLDFGIEVKVVAVAPGPVITRFELELAPGIKVSKISTLAKDIARSLSVVSVRVVEVIPGKSVIGLEIPNENREWVTLRELLESERYTRSLSPVSLVLGKDIAGEPIVVDLAKMPHMLVAGTTGSGKSVSINAMLLSMLFKSFPKQLRLILIDPKMLELSVYEGIPHLLTPVITDMKDAANALRWAVAEMDKRYRLMASLGVRNLASYNQRVEDAMKQGQPLSIPPALAETMLPATQLEPLPVIVIVADELADMMMVVGKKVEDLIARIAQKARAAGIHLILATQRPSVDVITGLIKANIPTRIAFQVSSRIDSRTILDQQGAEQLLGNGDMLYLPPGAGVPVRIHGAYVADEEVHRVAASWRTYGQPHYLHEVTQDVTGGAEGEGDEGGGELDPLYDQAVRVVTESRRASISLVQRRLRIGYNRAARMMEDMEAAGVVSTIDGSGGREVLAPPPAGV
ncbi:MAG: cell division protein FtsK [Gammaproteobacteria bacterium RIFCSPHIGHO2_12_FULL_41_20]|nr:MAG: cell division protein FtsK [Gammaproteobacteria bacterium RIFCSPHIGHO2_12_FULL_41_20]